MRSGWLLAEAPEVEMRDAIPRFGVRRPVTVVMAVLCAIVVGVLALERIPLQLLPSGFTPPFLVIVVGYPGANPDEVLEKVTRPVEERIATMAGIERMETVTNEGGMRCFLEFQASVDMDVAYTQVQDRVDRVRAEFPKSVRTVRIWRWNPNDMPIAYYAISFDPRTPDPHRLMSDRIAPLIERQGGVGRVELRGVYPRQVAIDLERRSLDARKLTISEMLERLERAAFVMGGGTVRHEGRIYHVRSLARFSDPLEVHDLELGTGARVRDVADVSYGIQSVGHVHRIDAKLAAGIRIYKEGTANTIEVCDRVEAAMRDLERDPKLQGFAFHPIFSQGEVIRESLSNLQETALIGGVLAVVVLFLFLRRFLMTAVVTLAIPLSVLLTVIVLYFTGDSLNILSLMGLMLALGMLVDNSVVVTESIARRMGEGESPEQAAVAGTGEVSLAVLLATLTTVVVFLPLILMQSQFRFFMAALGRPVCISLLASLFAALVVIPLAAKKLGGVGAKGEKKPGRVVGWAADVYARILKLLLRHRMEAAVLAIAVAGSAAYPFLNVKTTLSEEGGSRRLRVEFEFPETYGLLEANRVMDKVEATLLPRKEELGVRNVVTDFEARRGNLVLHLLPPKSGGLENKELREKLKELIPVFPGVTSSLHAKDEEDRGSIVSVRLEGPDHEVLSVQAARVRERLARIPDLEGLEVPAGPATPEIHMRVRRDAAQRYGVAPRRVLESVAYALGGSFITPLRMAEEEVDVIVGVRPSDRQYLDQLLSLRVPTLSGSSVALERLVAIERRSGPGTIVRENRTTSLTVQAETHADSLHEVYEAVEREMKTLDLPHGYRWSKGETYRDLQENEESQNLATWVSVALVFLLMAGFFESILLPFAILFSIPFSFAGVYWALYLTKTPMGVMAGIGTVVLIGIVVNNAIVLLDAVNQRRRQGLDRTEAIAEAGRARFRPILMTALTTVSGLVPMAWGTSSMIGISYAPLGRTVIGGLVASTLLTLFLVPLFYTFIDDAGAFFTERVRRVFGTKAPAENG